MSLTLPKTTLISLDKPAESGILEVVETLKKQFTKMSTECALLCIIQRGGGSKSFFCEGQLWTASQAQKKWDKNMLQLACGRLGVIRFYGGPPTKAKWYEGTMLSMLCDLILFDKHTEKMSMEEKLSI